MLSAAVEQSSKVTSPSPSCELSSFPDEMARNCFARVSRLDHVALSRVSKSHHSLVVSPEFYETRFRLGFTEECVYVFLVTPHEPNPRWFILRRGKDGKIYVFGGYDEEDNAPSNWAEVFDPKMQTWSR